MKIHHIPKGNCQSPRNPKARILQSLERDPGFLAFAEYMHQEV